MKSIITLGIALLATVATQASANSGLSELDFGTGSGNATAVSSHPKYVNEETVLNPAAYISSGYLKSVEEAMADNNKIVDAQEEQVRPLFLETSVNEIKEDNRIIEAQMPDYAPLDFNYINKAQEKLTIPNALPKL